MKDIERNLFHDRDIHEILKIPLINSNGPDKIIWRHNKDGLYSVRSAYHHVMERVTDNRDLWVPGEWSALWKLRLPNRAKVFLWRVARGVLPTRERLQRKGVECARECPFCHQAPENEWHLFIGCDQVKEVWQQLGLWDRMELIVNAAEGFSELLFNILANSLMQHKPLIAMTIWSIWWKRNSLVWENVNWTAFETARRAMDSLQDWVTVRTSGHNRSTQRLDGANHCWSKPGIGTLKCNVDAAMFFDSNRFWVGMCLRDDQGAFVKARTVWRPGTPLVQEAEAFGLLEALSWLANMNVTNILIELDS